MLEDDDKIRATDLFRPLKIVSVDGGHSDMISFSNTFSGNPENNAKWVRVEQVIGDFWYGKTVKEFNSGIDSHEFIRGDIPTNHLYGETNKERHLRYIEYLRCNVMQFGKYKEISFHEVMWRHPSYFKWAIEQGIINDETHF
jgi:hypothetical protein